MDAHPPRLSSLPVVRWGGGVDVLEARGLRARLLGLAGLRSPPGRSALLLGRCRSVHTFGMRWPLDLVWLGAAGALVRIDRGVPPRRVRACGRARAVVEVPAGGADAVVGMLAARAPPRAPLEPG